MNETRISTVGIEIYIKGFIWSLRGFRSKFLKVIQKAVPNGMRSSAAGRS
jgi:hypothetical protein